MIFDKKSLELLEFEKIYKKYLNLRKIPVTGSVENVEFITEAELLNESRVKSSFFRNLIIEEGFPNCSFNSEMPDFSPFKVVGYVADGFSLFESSDFIIQGHKYLKYIKNGLSLLDETDSFLTESEHYYNQELVKAAESVIRDFEPDGRLKETHPAVRKAAAQKKQVRDSIVRAADKYFSGSGDIWQDKVPVFRNGRTMLPVKAGCRSKVPGIVSSSSSSGMTSFIEPPEIIELNNSLVDIDNEIHRITNELLRSYSSVFSEFFEELTALQDYLTEADHYFSIAALSVNLKCCTAEISEHEFAVINARHPLLSVKPVPVTVTQEKGCLTTVISGPNTGGKTVILKTAGLFALMNQFGMDIPADSGSRLPLFTGIFADIGDHQSLELALSTYSSHVRSISRILQNAGDRSLVLLDELGTGTDPEEGGAVASAVVRHLLKKNIRSFITTHIRTVKDIALEDSRVINSSVEFDAEKKQPTYRLIPGTSGGSYAVETAEKYGMPESVIKQAREILESRITDIDIIKKNLAQKEQELSVKEAELSSKEKQLKEHIRQSDLKDLKLKQQEFEYRQKMRAGESSFVRESEKKLRKILQEIKSSEDRTKAEQFMKDLKSEDSRRSSEVQKREIELAEKNKQEFHEGMEVFVGKFRTKGTLLHKEKNRRWFVQTGSVKISVSEKDIIPDKQNNKKNKPKVSYVVEKTGKSADNFCIDCRGMRLDEALERVERAIDDNLLSGLNEFSVIHGTGNGILGPGIQEMLSRMPYVEKFNYAVPEDGGTGKTYIFLKK